MKFNSLQEIFCWLSCLRWWISLFIFAFCMEEPCKLKIWLFNLIILGKYLFIPLLSEQVAAAFR